MQNDKRKNKPAPSAGHHRKARSAGKKTSTGTSPQYTDCQRERMEQGLRILARMIARTHLRREASQGSETQPEPAIGP